MYNVYVYFLSKISFLTHYNFSFHILNMNYTMINLILTILDSDFISKISDIQLQIILRCGMANSISIS